MFTQTASRIRRASQCVAVLLIFSWPKAIIAAERVDLRRTLKQLGYEAIELRRTGDNHLYLFGKVEGRRRSCLVDTGWSFTAVSTNTAARLVETNRVRQLTLGRVVLTNELVMVSDMRVNGHPASYDVVLGCDFLLRHNAVIDCVERRLYLRRAELTEPERKQLEQVLRAAGLAAVEMKRRDPLALTCVARVGEDALELLVDSGAAWSCLDAKVVEKLKLRALPTANQIVGPAAIGRRSFAVADLKSWRLGELPMRETSVAVFSLKEWGLGPDGKLFNDVGGILGGAELFATRAVIDCGGLKLWLQDRR